MILAVDSGCGSIGPASWFTVEHPPRVLGLPPTRSRCTPRLISYARHNPAELRQPRPQSSKNYLRSGAEPRVLPMPLGNIRDPSRQLWNRPVGIIQAAVAALAPAYQDGEDQIQHAPRIRVGIPIVSRHEERHEATICTLDVEILVILITPN